MDADRQQVCQVEGREHWRELRICMWEPVALCDRHSALRFDHVLSILALNEFRLEIPTHWWDRGEGHWWDRAEGQHNLLDVDRMVVHWVVHGDGTMRAWELLHVENYCQRLDIPKRDAMSLIRALRAEVQRRAAAP